MLRIMQGGQNRSYILYGEMPLALKELFPNLMDFSSDLVDDRGNESSQWRDWNYIDSL